MASPPPKAVTFPLEIKPCIITELIYRTAFLGLYRTISKLNAAPVWLDSLCFNFTFVKLHGNAAEDMALTQSECLI